MLSISIVEDNLLDHTCDLLILKHAGAFYGVDSLVATRLNFEENVPAGEYALLAGRRLKARQVLFVGVGPLHAFRYAQIRKFGRQALKLASELIETPERISMPIHGPGYGLDESEAFLSLIAGIMDAVGADEVPQSLKTLEIVELDSRRVVRLRYLLGTALEVHPARAAKRGAVDITTRRGERLPLNASGLLDHEKAKNELANYGAPSEQKVRIFVAMPFKDAFSDEYEIAISDAAQNANIVCERIDKQAYVGDIMTQVKRRIATYEWDAGFAKRLESQRFLRNWLRVGEG